MRDKESNSLWDHITGECFAGPLAGKHLPFWHVSLTTVAAELANNPEAVLLKSNYRGLLKTLMTWVQKITAGKSFINRKGTTLPPHFRRTMSTAIDPRLSEGEQGLGVINDRGQARFYPIQSLPKNEKVIDSWQGRLLIIERGAIDGVPFATWEDNGDSPMQLLSRWYGFAFTYPDCEIFDPQALDAVRDQPERLLTS